MPNTNSLQSQINSLRMDAIQRALCTFSGSLGRWQKLAQTGATDEEIVERMNSEFGLGGGSSGPGWLPEHHKAYPPRIWLAKHGPDGDPSVAGKELINVVRKLFSICHRVPEGQLSLFGMELPTDNNALSVEK